MLYVAHLSQKVCHSTVHSYLSAIRHFHLAHGFSDPLRNNPRLDLVLKGLKRHKPSAKDARLPITPTVLAIIGQSLVQHFDHYDQLMIWAACCLGFFACLRSGEISLSADERFDPTIHLTPLDIAVDNHHNPSALQVRMKSSKTDQYQQGVNVYVGRTYNSLCPVVALRLTEVSGCEGHRQWPPVQGQGWFPSHEANIGYKGAANT